MPRPPRRTLCATDLTSRTLVQGLTGRILRLGAPKVRNVNKNVVNHCQLYARNGRLAGPRWYNLQNLKDAGYKRYLPADPNQLPLRKVSHIPCGQCGACAANEPCARLS